MQKKRYFLSRDNYLYWYTFRINDQHFTSVTRYILQFHFVVYHLFIYGICPEQFWWHALIHFNLQHPIRKLFKVSTSRMDNTIAFYVFIQVSFLSTVLHAGFMSKHDKTKINVRFWSKSFFKLLNVLCLQKIPLFTMVSLTF